MPTLAIVAGVKIPIYFDDHPPAHFPAVYGSQVAQIAIADLGVLRGPLSAPKLRAVREWAGARKTELMDAWVATQSKHNPDQIP